LGEGAITKLKTAILALVKPDTGNDNDSNTNDNGVTGGDGL
jgi:hypothetical protein